MDPQTHQRILTRLAGLDGQRYLGIPAALPSPAPIQALTGLAGVRLRNVERPVRNGRAEPLDRLWDLMTGLNGVGAVTGYAVASTGDGVEVWLVTEEPAWVALSAGLRAALPGVDLLPAGGPQEAVAAWGRAVQSWAARGLFRSLAVARGVPRTPGAAEPDPTRPQAPPAPVAWEVEHSAIDRLVAALLDQAWVWVVAAQPVPVQTVHGYVRQLTQLIAEDFPHQQYSDTNARSVLGQISHIDRDAQLLVQLCELELHRYRTGAATGLWLTRAAFSAPTPATLQAGASLLRALFGATTPAPEPFAAQPCARTPPEDVTTSLTSSELATLCVLPSREWPGYGVRPAARFRLDLPADDPTSAPAATLELGSIVGLGPPGRHHLTTSRDRLTMHALVCGVTGSGKSNTCLHLLDEIWARREAESPSEWQARRAPFLVVEPAEKSEYRSLAALESFSDLRVFTLGNDNLAPFRLNPFVVPPGVPVQTHLDHLKALFQACFVLYAPMPYVLDRCLQEVYTDRGWDLAANRNRRGEGEIAFPTLSDLWRKVDPVVRDLGYEHRIAQDVRAALRVRIDSLRQGSKGLMLDTRRSVDLDDLVAWPTVLELQGLGSDDEKAFVIGLLLLMLFERVAYRPPDPAVENRLRHLIVIEEAHRLLRNVPPPAGEGASPQYQAISTFANMLAEIRAYGVGLMVVEQIPTKLIPDVLKNTDLKIVHRTVAADDREALGGAMAMDADQQAHLTRLPRGRAVCYSSATEGPVLVDVPRFGGDRGLARSIAPATWMRRFYAEHQGLLAQSNGCRWCGESDSGPRCRSLPPAAGLLVESLPFRRTFAAFMLAILGGEAADAAGYHAAYRRLHETAVRLECDRDGSAWVAADTACLLHRVADRFLDGRAQARGGQVDFATVEQAQAALADLMHRLHRTADTGSERTGNVLDLGDWPRAAARLRAALLSEQEPGPFLACRACRARCLFREDAALLLESAADGSLDLASTAPQPATLAGHALEQASALTPGNAGPLRSAVALCYAAQLTAGAGLAPGLQLQLADLLGGPSGDGLPARRE